MAKELTKTQIFLYMVKQVPLLIVILYMMYMEHERNKMLHEDRRDTIEALQKGNTLLEIIRFKISAVDSSGDSTVIVTRIDTTITITSN